MPANASFADVCGSMIGLIVPLIRTNDHGLFTVSCAYFSRAFGGTTKGEKQFVRLRLLNGLKGEGTEL